MLCPFGQGAHISRLDSFIESCLQVSVAYRLSDLMNLKVSLSLIKHLAIKPYGGVECS
jgi:hypothetical protein